MKIIFSWLVLLVLLFGQVSVSAQSSVWTAGMETGDLSEWTSTEDSGQCSRPGSGTSTQQAHTGTRSLKMTINTFWNSAGCRNFRKPEADSGDSYYYSAWFYLPQHVQVGSSFNIWQYKGKPDGSSESKLYWKIDIRNRPDGQMVAWLIWKGDAIEGPLESDGMGPVFYTQTEVVIPVGEWVNFEVYLDQSGDFDGHITVWQDGELLYDVSDVRTKHPGGSQNWSVNNYGASLNPSTVVMFIDDAEISSSRIWQVSEPTATPTDIPTVTPTPTPTFTPTPVPTATPTVTPTPTPISLELPAGEIWRISCPVSYTLQSQANSASLDLWCNLITAGE